MDPVRNPYAPGAGTPPPELTGREDLIEHARITLARIRQGRPAKSYIAVGLRGVGKTVLLSHVRRMAESADDIVCAIEAHEHKNLPELVTPYLRRVLLELDRLGQLNVQVKRGLRVLKAFMSTVRIKMGEAELSLDIDPEIGSADSGDLEADLPELLVAIGKAAQARGRAVVLVLDEIQYLSERDMSALIMGLHRIAQDSLPVAMIGAGLPQVVGLTGRSKFYAERLFEFPQVDALDLDDATRAIVAPAEAQSVTFTPDAVADLFAISRGYPYFIQEWAYHAWNAAAGPEITRDDVTRATPIALDRLDQSFFRVRFDRLTPREKDYVRAMADLGPGPHRSGDIAERLQIRAASVAPLRSGLIVKGMIYSPAHGDTAFTVPLFHEFLRRIMPIWSSPYRRDHAQPPN
jgi:hypothetical protein